MVTPYPQSVRILEHNRKYIAGGIVSINRAIQPEIVFVKGQGAYLWDAEGKQYLDYHAAFSPHFLGHNDPDVNAAVARTLDDGTSLFGAGGTEFEGRLAELICTHIPWVESVQFLNSGSEATSQAIRVARAATGRSHVVLMQGGYNGWGNDVAFNLMTPLDETGPHQSPGEYRLSPIIAGIPEEHQRLIHCVNFNDLESIRYVCDRYPVAAVITEPILQNIGLVLPQPGYLKGLRALATELGFVLIFDEVKTGFRHAFGGYAEISGVTPDLVVYGKALANGYPISALGGRADLMELFFSPDRRKRVLLAGTSNAHPVPTAAAIATLERLLKNQGEVYRHVEKLGKQIEDGVSRILRKLSATATLVRQGSAFCLYFMDHAPRDWHDLASHHNFEADLAMRQQLIDEGIFFFPMPTKQCSVSFAHSEQDVATTLAAMECVLSKLPAPALAPAAQNA
jgi:glutamate-1-semialdehyde 2,1-aminomutase